MSATEATLLSESRRVEDRDLELNPHDDDASDILEDGPHTKKRDPLHVLILYGLSFAISVAGFGTAMWGYSIVLTSPFDEYSKKKEKDSYEKYFWGMQSIVILLAINILWSGFNYRLGCKGKQNDIWPLNMAYDFLIWALLIAYGLLNMLEMLWDRRLCDGWRDDDMYKKCGAAMFKLLVVEMVAVNLGLLVAVFHFILLVGRCCTQGRRKTFDPSLRVLRRVREEEDLLFMLMERRRQLTEENEELEARRLMVNRELPPLPAEAFGDYQDNPGEETQPGQVSQSPEEVQPPEDLIDIATNEREAAIQTTEHTLPSSSTEVGGETRISS